MQDYRYCTQISHDQQQIQYVCMYDKCTLPRLLCSQCLFKEIHKHQYNNNKHIVTLEILNQIMLTDLEMLYKKYQRKQIEFRNLIQLMKNQLDAINEQIQQIRKRMLHKQNLKNLITPHNFSLIDEDIIKEIIKDQQFQIDHIAITQLLNQTQITNQSSYRAQQSQTIQQQIQSLQNTEYDVLPIDQQQNMKTFYTAAMSKNQQFIACGGSEGILKIYNNRQQTHNFNYQKIITNCKFSQDDQYLYVAIESELAQLSVFEGFQSKKIIEIKNKQILDFIFITNTILLVINNKFISKIDFQTQQITLDLLAHNKQIQSIDIYENRMISSSLDNSIKLWNQMNGKLLICQEEVCSQKIDIRQVKFIQFDQFLCLSNGKISLWIINNTKNVLQILKQFKSNNYILQIHFIFGGQLIILIQDRNIQITNLKGEKVKSIDHKVKQINYSNCSQSPNLMQFLIQGENQIVLCKYRNS